MANYKQSDVAGTQWVRANRVVIENHLDQVPTILFMEENVINIGATTVRQPLGNIMGEMDSNNPLHVEIYTKLNELYVILRTARDERSAVDYSPTPGSQAAIDIALCEADIAIAHASDDFILATNEVQRLASLETLAVSAATEATANLNELTLASAPVSAIQEAQNAETIALGEAVAVTDNLTRAKAIRDTKKAVLDAANLIKVNLLNPPAPV